MNKAVFGMIILVGFGFFHPNVLYAAVSIEQAAKQISATNGSRVLSAKTELIKGRKVHVIKSLTPNGRIQHHYIDVESGAIIHQS